MSNIKLTIMTHEFCHEFFKGFQSDADIYMDMSKYNEYQYDKNKVDAYFETQQKTNRIVFLIMLDDKPIGEIKLKDIDYETKSCTLSIHLQNDLVKNKGYGTKAEKLAIDYAFNELHLNKVYADAVLKNERSQHVLEKVGFTLIRKDDTFMYYVIEK
ncbi:MAG: GNAT family N-acetyltransferase [Erysipelotrichales bacterium]|nr:GNAT family N-acetyltransferase [Erysipelotrichales bacterium]